MEAVILWLLLLALIVAGRIASRVQERTAIAEERERWAMADVEEPVDFGDCGFQPITLELNFTDVDPELLNLLYGQPLADRPWWYRWLPRFLKRKVKGRWIRRGYGG